jgi:rubrerythrin
MADRLDAAARPPGRSQAGPANRGQPRDEYDDVPGDPACWLCRVCPACGAMADEDPPTTCPQCRAPIPRG